MKGYSEASIKMMRTFYEEWKELFEIRQLKTDELSSSDLASFLSVGFTNHYVILTKVKTKEERLFYIRRCASLPHLISM